MKYFKRVLAVLLAAILLSACSSRPVEQPDAGAGTEDLPANTESVSTANAATMRLLHTEGSVRLSDEQGTPIPLQQEMRLFSGNAVDTEESSLARIGLDDVKLLTVGESSCAAVHQGGKKLSIDLERGIMYFSVSRPLRDDESFEISTANITLGIRGTSGFVSALSETLTAVILTSGHAVITASDGISYDIDHGQRAVVTSAEDGSSCTVSPVRPEEYPALLLNELQADEQIREEIREQNGAEYDNWLAVMAAYRQILQQADSYDYRNDWTTPTGIYHYALEQVVPELSVPTLLLSQEGEDFYDYTRVFQYDPVSGTVFTPAEVLSYGVALTGGQRSGLQLMEDGNGFRQVSASFNGDLSIERIILEGNQLVYTNAWSGRIDQQIPSGLGGTEITWHELYDLEELDRGLALPAGPAVSYRQYEGTWINGVLGPDLFDYSLAVKFTDETHLKFAFFAYRLAATYTAIEAVLDPTTGIAAFSIDESSGSGIAGAEGTIRFHDNQVTILFDRDPTGYLSEAITLDFYSGSPSASDNLVEYGAFEFRYAASIKEQLGIPADLVTEDRIYAGQRSYWEAGNIYLIRCEFYHDGTLIASAMVNAETGELARDIYAYNGQ